MRKGVFGTYGNSNGPSAGEDAQFDNFSYSSMYSTAFNNPILSDREGPNQTARCHPRTPQK